MMDDLMMSTFNKAKALGIPFIVMMKIDNEERHSVAYWRRELRIAQRIEPHLTMVQMMTSLADVIAQPVHELSKGGQQ